MDALVATASAIRDVREHFEQAFMPLDFQLISGSPLVLDVLGVVEAAWIALHIGRLLIAATPKARSGLDLVDSHKREPARACASRT